MRVPLIRCKLRMEEQRVGQGADGVSGSLSCLMTALCKMGIPPVSNPFFNYDVRQTTVITHSKYGHTIRTSTRLFHIYHRGRYHIGNTPSPFGRTCLQGLYLWQGKQLYFHISPKTSQPRPKAWVVSELCLSKTDCPATMFPYFMNRKVYTTVFEVKVHSIIIHVQFSIIKVQQKVIKSESRYSSKDQSNYHHILRMYSKM